MERNRAFWSETTSLIDESMYSYILHNVRCVMWEHPLDSIIHIARHCEAFCRITIVLVKGRHWYGAAEECSDVRMQY